MILHTHEQHIINCKYSLFQNGCTCLLIKLNQQQKFLTDTYSNTSTGSGWYTAGAKLFTSFQTTDQQHLTQYEHFVDYVKNIWVLSFHLTNLTGKKRASAGIYLAKILSRKVKKCSHPEKNNCSGGVFDTQKKAIRGAWIINTCNTPVMLSHCKFFLGTWTMTENKSILHSPSVRLNF